MPVAEVVIGKLSFDAYVCDHRDDCPDSQIIFAVPIFRNGWKRSQQARLPLFRGLAAPVMELSPERSVSRR
ncbi:hypothetical protein AGR3A_Lc140021 [Agrobacterium tomkonis CFBP 6623]|uniref:Uncharacterized protein n=1 Tax=Agrobacterium tomkonis CFBP 6623 TaxID=1183432 RepID=A0A1S7RJZ0_9HYPH|nr:hypothetical protein AGR3A_Lc140021 [Agrobacterium tomkonis CFBP 6623]